MRNAESKVRNEEGTVSHGGEWNKEEGETQGNKVRKK